MVARHERGDNEGEEEIEHSCLILGNHHNHKSRSQYMPCRPSQLLLTSRMYVANFTQTSHISAMSLGKTIIMLITIVS